jgi:hypothetical protein
MAKDASNIRSVLDQTQHDGGLAAPAAAVSVTPGNRRETAIHQLFEARQLYRLAELVHERSRVGSIDSSPLAYKSLNRLLTLLHSLHSRPAPTEFEELVESASLIADDRGFGKPDLLEDLRCIARVRARFIETADDPATSEGRRYEQAFLRLKELFKLVESEVDLLLPTSPRGVRRHWQAAVILLLGIAIGTALGARLGARPPAANPAPKPKPAAAQTPPAAPAVAAETGSAFAATFYRDAEFREVAFETRHETIAFTWGAEPPGLDRADEFGVRWIGRLSVPAQGAFQFFLTSDDGSRLFIDDRLVIDNWGGHSAVTKHASVDLAMGTHELRVDFYDVVGDAIVRLEWSSETFAQRLITSADLQ